MVQSRTFRAFAPIVALIAFCAPASADEYDDTVRCFYMLGGASEAATAKNRKELGELDVALRQKIVRIRPKETEAEGLARVNAAIAMVENGSLEENLTFFRACAASFAIDLKFP
jgi:hypothetical protein